MILPYVREIYLIIFSSLLQHGVIIQSVIKERGAQNHGSMQKEKDWSGWDLNSKFSFDRCSLGRGI
jgi:hypothetical protein